MAKNNDTTSRRQARVRRSLRARAYGKPRLTVFRSSKQIYCQIIDDTLGQTLAAASSLEKANRDGLKTGATVESAKSSSTAAPISIMAALRRSRKAPAKAGSNFKTSGQEGRGCADQTRGEVEDGTN